MTDQETIDQATRIIVDTWTDEDEYDPEMIARALADAGLLADCHQIQRAVKAEAAESPAAPLSCHEAQMLRSRLTGAYSKPWIWYRRHWVGNDWVLQCPLPFPEGAKSHRQLASFSTWRKAMDAALAHVTEHSAQRARAERAEAEAANLTEREATR